MLLFVSFNAVRFFFFNDTATTEIYTLSLHDALPISFIVRSSGSSVAMSTPASLRRSIGYFDPPEIGRPRLNSSHGYISYAVFCLKKKKQTFQIHTFKYTKELRSTHDQPI